MTSLLRAILLLAPLLLSGCYLPADSSPTPAIGERPVAPATVVPQLPTEDRTKEHPRLFFTSEEIETLRAQAQSTHQEIWAPIEEYVISELGTTPLSSVPPDENLDTFRNHGNQLIPFAFACVITDRIDICNLAEAYLLAYASWEAWSLNGERGLALAHMLYGSAIAYDWLYERLGPGERQAVRESLGDRAQQLYEASISDKVATWNNFWTDAYVQNHFYVNHSALGLAGLVLLGEDARAQSWIDRVVERLSRGQYLLNGIGDGSWHEGQAYQGYMLTLSLPFLVNLRDIVGLDLIPHIYLQNYIYWRLYNYLPGTVQSIMAYGDMNWEHSEYRPQNVLRFTARTYANGHAEWLARQLIAAEGRFSNVWATPWYTFEFLYYDAQVTAEPPTELSAARIFPDLEGVIWRTGWRSNDLVFGLKTGAYGGRFAYDTFLREVYPWNPPCPETNCKLSFGHDHDDANGFYLWANGGWLAPETVETGERETSFHNTLLIDGQGQFRPPREDQKENEDMVEIDGYLETTVNTPAFNYVAADATRRYKHVEDLLDFTRHVLFVRPGYFLMVDNVAATAAHRYEWVSHFSEAPVFEGSWIRGDVADDQILGVGMMAPEAYVTETGEDGQPFVHLRPAEPLTEVRFVMLLYPTDSAAWEERPEATVVTDNGEMLLARIIQNDGSQQQDDVLVTYGAMGETATLADYTFDGRVAVIQRRDGDIKKLFVYGGTVLRDEETEVAWIRSPAASGALEITYEADTISVYGQLTDELTIYAPGGKQLFVHGLPWDEYARSGDYITIQATPLFSPLNEQ